jgi:hypothetical protein
MRPWAPTRCLVTFRLTLSGSQSGELIYIEGYSDVAIFGGGVFDGQGNAPKMLKSEHKKHFLIQDVTFKDSPDHNLVTYSDYLWKLIMSGFLLRPPRTTQMG